METYSLSGLVTANKQGDFNSNGSTSFSNSTMKLDFSSSLTKFRNAVDVNAITINSAILYITCTDSGKADKKRFYINYYNTGNTQTLTSKGVAYNRTTTITLNTSYALKWIQSGSQIRSTDPDIKGSGYSSNSGGRYSENYVKVSSTYITINYTINKSSFTNLSSDFYFRANNQLTWKVNNPDYIHTITLTPEDTTTSYTLLEQNKIPENYIDNVSFINENNHNEGINFLLPEEIAETYMIDKITLKASLSIQTFNSSGGDLGTEIKSITLLIDPKNYPYNISIKEENLENLTPWPDEKNLIIIANHTKPKFSIDASSDLGAEITSCLFKFQDGQSFKIEKKEDLTVFSCEPTFTNITDTDLKVEITLTDSRGINIQEITAFTGASLLNKSVLNITSLSANDEPISPLKIYGYQKPEIKNFTVQRFFQQKKETENGEIYIYILDEFEGKHIKITNFEKNNTEKINQVDNSLEYFLKIQDNKTLKIINDWGGPDNEEVPEGNFKKIKIEDYLPLTYNDLELLITLKISDSFNSHEKTFILDSAHYLLHFRRGESSIGIGTAAESIPLDDDTNEPMFEGLITMGWPVKMKKPLEVEYGGTGVSSIKCLFHQLFNLIFPVDCLYVSVSDPGEVIFPGTNWEILEQHTNYSVWKRLEDRSSE